ncbi:MAG: flagellar motor protein MotA [Alphaproteobacteria bacterium]
MTKPSGFLARMLLSVAIVAAAVAAESLLSGALSKAFMANAVLNGGILVVFFIGILHVFRMVHSLGPEVNWIDHFRGDQKGTGATPRLLSPMATMLGERSERGLSISLSTNAMRTLLDGIATRLDERREFSRYMIGLLVFLGLLGTFWGLLITVRSVSDVIGGLNVGGGDAGRMFDELKIGLAAPLGGMGTAFSSSLFGLAGSLVLGLLDLQAGHAQNRFYNELEDWLSEFTRLSSGGIGGEGETSVPAYIQALLEKTADSLERLERTMSQAEGSRDAADRRIMDLTEKLGALGDQMRTEQNLMVKLAQGQIELGPVLSKLADGSGGDPAVRLAVRSIDATLTRLAEDTATARGETVAELRAEIRLLARTIAAAAGQPLRES